MRKILIMCTIAIGLLVGCRKPPGLVLDDQGVNSWIYKTISDNYLWASTIPGINTTNTDLYPDIYFDTYLRYRADKSVSYDNDTYGDRFSRLNNTGQQGRAQTSMAAYEDQSFASETKVSGYGINVRFVSSLSGTLIYVQVIYVVPGSPADKAGLMRGDRITTMNGVKLNHRSDFNSIMDSPTVELDIDYPHNRKRKIEMSKAEYYDTPTILDTIYNTSPKTGYIFFTHFTSGASNRFINELNEIFARFRAEGVRDLVLDLRYNGGGELTMARHIASLIARRDMLGEVLIYKETRGSYGRPELFSPENFMSAESLIKDYNLDAQRVCIISSQNTASASELIMHSLKPYYGKDLIVVGCNTLGKNVGSIEITNRRYLWKINPITIRVYDKNRVSGYEDGIEPDLPCIEVGNGSYDIYPLGDVENETMLNMAMSTLHPYKYTTKRVPAALMIGGDRLTIETSVPNLGLITDRITVE